MKKLKLKYCANCIQMTNHLNGICQKCKKMININNINENCNVNSNEDYYNEDDYAYDTG